MSIPITTTTGAGIALPAGGGFGASRSGTRCGLEAGTTRMLTGYHGRSGRINGEMMKERKWILSDPFNS